VGRSRDGAGGLSVVEQPSHSQPNTLKCCGLLTRATPPAWSVFKPTFAEPWDGFQRAYPRDDRRYSDGLGAKMLGGGEPDQMGAIDYRCLPWGRAPIAWRCAVKRIFPPNPKC
jgi:hypothetical protein